MPRAYNRKTTPKKKILSAARRIKLLILDVDGVMTDGSIILDNFGNELKAFHVRDGHGMKMLMNAGIRVALISGRQSKVVEIRAAELGIEDVIQKCYDKSRAYDALADKYSFDNSEIACMGDDIVDVPILKKCGFPVAVADAEDEVKASALLTTKRRGGRGAVRELCDLLLNARNQKKDSKDGNA